MNASSLVPDSGSRACPWSNGRTSVRMYLPAWPMRGRAPLIRDEFWCAVEPLARRGLDALVHDRVPIVEGMAVVGGDMRPVGRVQSVRDHDFLIDRPVLPDIAVPYDAVRDITNDLIVLTAPAKGVDYLPGVIAVGGNPGRGEIRTGMEVDGSDREQIGWVKARYPDAVLVARGLERAIYVPYDAVQSITASGVVLTVPAAEVDYQGWAYPPLSES